MPSRGTLQRDAQAEQRTSWAGPTPPSERRPPSAPRERKPALAALAVLLIVGGALGAGYLVLQNSKHVGAVEVTTVVTAGQQIKITDLTEVQVPANTDLAYVPWTEVQQVTRSYAATTLPRDTLLTSAMTTGSTARVANSEARVGLAVKDGQYVDQVQIGDHVNIWADNDPNGCPTGRFDELAHSATVLAITSPPSATGNVDIEAAIPIADQYVVTCNAAAGNVSVTIEPGSAQAAGGATTGSARGYPSTSKSPATGHHSARAGNHSSPPASSPSPSTSNG
jgi:hypothetical protein